MKTIRLRGKDMEVEVIRDKVEVEIIDNVLHITDGNISFTSRPFSSLQFAKKAKETILMIKGLEIPYFPFPNEEGVRDSINGGGDDYRDNAKIKIVCGKEEVKIDGWLGVDIVTVKCYNNNLNYFSLSINTDLNSGIEEIAVLGLYKHKENAEMIRDKIIEKAKEGKEECKIPKDDSMIELIKEVKRRGGK